MRKRMISLLAVTMAMSLCACQGEKKEETKEDRTVMVERDTTKQSAVQNEPVKEKETTVKEKTTTTKKEEIPATKEEETTEIEEVPEFGKLKVIDEYTYNKGENTFHIMVLENTYDYTIEIYDTNVSKAVAYNENGDVICENAAIYSQKGIKPGEKTFYFERYETKEKIDHYEQNIKIVKDRYNISLSESLSETHKIESNFADVLHIEVTNNGNEHVENIDIGVLYFKDGELVYMDTFGWLDFMNGIDPGKTARTKSGENYHGFDDVKLFLHGSSPINN